MPAQDSYSYELTDIKVGADDMSGLADKYERTVAALRPTGRGAPDGPG